MREEKRKILLIQPPFYRLFKDTYSLDRYPLSLGYIGGTIRRDSKWDVRTWNTDFSMRGEQVKISYFGDEGHKRYLECLETPSYSIWREIRNYIEAYRPSVVGISTNSQNIRSTAMVAKIAKEVDRDTIVIVGGPHPSIVGVDALRFPNIDIGVRGEGERTILELLHSLENDRDIDDVKGVIHRKGGKIVETSPREYIEDLDSLCFPHEYAPEILKDFEDYPSRAFQQIFAVRGCPHNCSFCGSRWIWSRKPRFRSPENVVAQIQSLKKSGIRRIVFEDDTFGIHPGYIRRLCAAMKETCQGIPWRCEIHAGLVTGDTIDCMKEAGCDEIFLGVESGNNDILKAMNKGITIERAIDASRIIRAHGIRLSIFIMIGFVGETEATLKDTLVAIQKMKPNFIIFSIFMPYPNTSIFQLCREKGLIDEKYDVSIHNHQSFVNNFSDIPHGKYAILIRKVSRIVDRYNYCGRLKEVWSLDTLGKIRRIGFAGSIRKGFRILTCK